MSLFDNNKQGLTMRRFLFIFLWLAILLIAGRLFFFVFFNVWAPQYNEGQPLTVATVPTSAQRISALHHDGTGNVWMGTEGNGIHRFDTIKNETQSIVVPAELRNAKIRSLAMDQYGRLWVGTLRDGLFVRRDNGWKQYDVGQRIPAIKTYNDRTFIATEKGLVVYDSPSDTWTDITLMQPTTLAFDSNGNVFVGTASNGIFLLTCYGRCKYTTLAGKISEFSLQSEFSCVVML
jgi:ligand-binding sensor domain-containing protein